MNSNPERVAWVVMLFSLFACVSLAVLTPLAVRQHVLYAEENQNVALEVQRPPLRVTLSGRGQTEAATEDRDELPPRSIVATDSTAGRLVMHAPREDETVVATAQLYDNTEVVLVSAKSPRYSSSRLPHYVTLQVNTGRVRISVSSGTWRPAVTEVRTAQGVILLTEGSYEVKVNGGTSEVTVRDGHAELSHKSGESAQLDTAQRATFEANGILSPLPAARNLVANGDFKVPLADSWSTYLEVTDPEQPSGRLEIVSEQGREAVDFERVGTNHAEVGIRQDIDYDVRDFTSLEVHLAVRIINQNIAGYGGCGYLSSECPIIVVMDYKDIYGTDRQWRRGFYTGEPHPDWPLYPWTEQLSRGTWQTYDSANLMEELSGFPPAVVKRLTLYASGHSFHARAMEIELLAQE
jgi:hypothetical protein